MFPPLGRALGTACNELLARIFEKTTALIAAADQESIPELLQNIIVTGGGSRIREMAPTLQLMLQREGFTEPRVQTIGRDYKKHVAGGALKAAIQAKERQWQRILS